MVCRRPTHECTVSQENGKTIHAWFLHLESETLLSTQSSSWWWSWSFWSSLSSPVISVASSLVVLLNVLYVDFIFVVYLCFLFFELVGICFASTAFCLIVGHFFFKRCAKKRSPNAALAAHSSTLRPKTVKWCPKSWKEKPQGLALAFLIQHLKSKICLSSLGSGIAKFPDTELLRCCHEPARRTFEVGQIWGNFRQIWTPVWPFRQLLIIARTGLEQITKGHQADYLHRHVTVLRPRPAWQWTGC